MQQHYVSWLSSLNGKLKFEAELQEEAQKIAKAGGYIETRIEKTEKGKNKTVRELKFKGKKYTPKVTLGRKSLKKLSMYIEDRKNNPKNRK